MGLIRPFRALRWCIDSVPRAMPWAFVGRPVGAWVASPSTFEWGYSYSYSYSNRWDHGMDLSGVHVGSSTSTALRAEYEYERDRGHGVDGGRRCGAPADDSPQRQPGGCDSRKGEERRTGRQMATGSPGCSEEIEDRFRWPRRRYQAAVGTDRRTGTRFRAPARSGGCP